MTRFSIGVISGFCHPPKLLCHNIFNIWSVKNFPNARSSTSGFGWSCDGDASRTRKSDAWNTISIFDYSCSVIVTFFAGHSIFCIFTILVYWILFLRAVLELNSLTPPYYVLKYICHCLQIKVYLVSWVFIEWCVYKRLKWYNWRISLIMLMCNLMWSYMLVRKVNSIN